MALYVFCSHFLAHLKPFNPNLFLCVGVLCRWCFCTNEARGGSKCCLLSKSMVCLKPFRRPITIGNKCRLCMCPWRLYTITKWRQLFGVNLGAERFICLQQLLPVQRPKPSSLQFSRGGTDYHHRSFGRNLQIYHRDKGK